MSSIKPQYLPPAFIEYPRIVQEHPLDTYARSMIEREEFLEVAKMIAQSVATQFQQNSFSEIFAKISQQRASNQQAARQELTWEQQDAFFFHKTYSSEVSAQATCYPSYITSNAILVVGSLLGTGVTREVRMGAEIRADGIRACAMNFLRTDNALYSHDITQKNYEHLRTFQMQERLREIEPSLPQITKTLYRFHDSDSNSKHNTVCILTELFQGSLEDRAKHLSPSTGFDKILRFRSFQQISKQLMKLHQEGIVHRDLHDKNVLVRLEKGNEDGYFDVHIQATLCDFETVGPIFPQIPSEQTPLHASLTEIGYLNKAPRSDGPCHPPELRKLGSDWIYDYTRAADIYALGLMALTQFGGRQFLMSKAPPERILHALSAYGELAELVLRALSPQTEIHPTLAEIEYVLTESLTTAHPDECNRLLEKLKTMSVPEFAEWILKEKKLDQYRYWNPECLTTEYIHKALDFVPGFALIVQKALAEDPESRPSAKDFVDFFENAEGSFQEILKQYLE
ncbi:MAG: lipopolysaccharide kinase InaA family protein [Parachlamydiales bacterium]|jgi:serine/threonine protein kinase